MLLQIGNVDKRASANRSESDAPAAATGAAPSTSPIELILQDGLVTRALVPGLYFVGQLELCGFRLVDPSVEARHAQLVISDAALIVDLSESGTYVNGERIRGPRSLSNGDRLRFGSRELTVWLRPLRRAAPQTTDESATGLPAPDGAAVTASTDSISQATVEGFAMSDSQPRRSARKQLLLVVEDDAAMREELKGMLEQAGYRVLLADDGQTALSVLDQLKPHLILLDIMMPLVSGWEVMAVIEQTPALASVPVVVMSGYAVPVQRKVAHVLKKPFSGNELLQVVQHQLRE